MKHRLSQLAGLFWLALLVGTAFGADHYVRPDGGTRHSSNMAFGQCNGSADASYVFASGATPGEYWYPSQSETLGATLYVPNGHYATVTTGGTSGTAITWPTSGTVSGTGGTAVYTVSASMYPVNANCAFNSVQMFYQDGSYATDGSPFPALGWIGAGGDHYIVRGSIADGVSYRIGWPFNNSNCFTPDGAYCWGLNGDYPASWIPPPPAGSAGAHTVFEGGNAGACAAQNARTQLHGGWGVGQVLALYGASYLDVLCFDITDFSACGWDNGQVPCQGGGGTIISDYAKNGIGFDNVMHDVTLTDMRIHGLAADGINGPPGPNVTMTDIAILGNENAGWNADNGSGTTGVGATNVTNFDISWNGCSEQYPIVDPLPYFGCRDQDHGGYGDGFGTTSLDSPSPGWQLSFTQGTVSYNTQDGLDALHIAGPGSTVTETQVLAFGNEGQQLKVGGARANVSNSLIVGNCYALSQQVIPGRPIPTNDLLGTACRAGNTAVLVTTSPGTPTKFQDNTIFSSGSVAFEFEYATGDTGPTNVLQYDNNVFVGFLNPDNSQNPTPIFTTGDFSALTNPGASWTHNSYFGSRDNWTCPNGSESNALCVSPQLVDMTWHPYGYGNMAPASLSSSVVGAGVTISGISDDYNGDMRPDPPSIGAIEPAGTGATGTLFNGVLAGAVVH